MSTDKTNKHAQATSDQRSDDNNNASQDAPPPTDNTHLSDSVSYTHLTLPTTSRV